MDDQREPNGHLPEPRGDGLSPEQEELALKRQELTALHETAVAKEIKLETLRAQLEGFVGMKLFRLGDLYARIDDLQLRIAQAQHHRDPENPVLQRRAQEAEARAAASREASHEAAERGPPRRITLTPHLRSAYLDAARRIHPDLGRTPNERELRHALMVRLNEAYVVGDIDGVEDVIARWEAQSAPDDDPDVAEDLVRVIRSIARYRKTIERLDREISDLRERPDHTLMVRVIRAEAEGGDLLGDMEEKLHSQIRKLEATLGELGEEPR